MSEKNKCKCKCHGSFGGKERHPFNAPCSCESQAKTITDPNQLLENWGNHPLKNGCTNLAINFKKGELVVKYDDVVALLQAQEAKTREECAKIIFRYGHQQAANYLNDLGYKEGDEISIEEAENFLQGFLYEAHQSLINNTKSNGS